MLPQPKLEHIAAGRARIRVCYELRAWPFEIRVLPPFEFDGASIPKVLHPFLGGPYDRRRLPAATVHDWIYASHAIPKWMADLIFLYLLILNGMPIWRAVADWWAVSRFGYAAWSSHGAAENARAITLGSVDITF